MSDLLKDILEVLRSSGPLKAKRIALALDPTRTHITRSEINSTLYKAKGLKGWVVTIKHALRNALIPIITIAGSDLGNILTGSVLVESVFSIPGIGKMLVDSINTRDLPIVQGGVMYIAVICVIMYLVVDLLYTVVDPRIRLGKESS